MKLLVCLIVMAFGFVLLLIPGAGCRSTTASKMRVEEEVPVPFFTREGQGVPLLSTNEVLRIAYETARKSNFNLAGYVCTGMHFGGNSTNDWIKGRWLVNFDVSPKTVDYHVFILIDDETQSAKLYAR